VVFSSFFFFFFFFLSFSLVAFRAILNNWKLGRDAAVFFQTNLRTLSRYKTKLSSVKWFSARIFVALETDCADFWKISRCVVHHSFNRKNIFHKKESIAHKCMRHNCHSRVFMSKISLLVKHMRFLQKRWLLHARYYLRFNVFIRSRYWIVRIFTFAKDRRT
jgi:hypothetical protein